MKENDMKVYASDAGGSRAAECAAYFRAKPAFERGMEMVRDKWRSYGKSSGTVRMKKASDEEQEAWGAFLGKFWERGAVQFTLREFEAALGRTRFGTVDLHDLLEAYFQMPVSDKKTEKAWIENARQERRALFQERLLQNYGPDCPGVQWLLAFPENRVNEYLEEPSGQGEARLFSVVSAMHALNELREGETVRLAVLAMEHTGNPHGFDRGTPLGNLLIRALMFWKEDFSDDFSDTEEERGGGYVSAEAVLELYLSCHILPDDLSSFTVLYGVSLMEGDHEHIASISCWKCGEPYLASLSNLRRITAVKPVRKTVFVVENQMVFSELCERCPEASLICSSGQMKTATLHVLDMLCREDCRIFYGSDLDPEGLGMADRLIRRSKGKIIPWHMSPEDYLKCTGAVYKSDAEMISRARLTSLNRIRDERLRATAELIRGRGIAGYQEMLIEDMATDIRASETGGV